jgi:hypothetical protein
MPIATRVVTKALAAQQDLLIGEGTASQSRAGAVYTVDMLRMLGIVNDETDLIALDPAKFPKALLFRSGYYEIYVHNGIEYEEVVPVTSPTTIATALAQVSTIGKRTLVFSVATPHTIDALSNGAKGQELNLISTTTNTTIASNASISLKGGVDKLLAAYTGIRLVCLGSIWVEV